MTTYFFVTQFPCIATMLTVGLTTTVEFNGKAFSFKKIARGQFEAV